MRVSQGPKSMGVHKYAQPYPKNDVRSRINNNRKQVRGRSSKIGIFVLLMGICSHFKTPDCHL